jgi:hypothetical protein
MDSTMNAEMEWDELDQAGLLFMDDLGERYLFCNRFDALLQGEEPHYYLAEDPIFGKQLLGKLRYQTTWPDLLRKIYRYARPYDHMLHRLHDYTLLDRLIRMLGTGELKVWSKGNLLLPDLPEIIYKKRPDSIADSQESIDAERPLIAENSHNADENSSTALLNIASIPDDGLCHPDDGTPVEGPVMKSWDEEADKKRARDMANTAAALEAMGQSPLAAAAYVSAKESGIEDTDRLLGAANTGLSAEGLIAPKQTGEVINRSVGLGAEETTAKVVDRKQRVMKTQADELETVEKAYRVEKVAAKESELATAIRRKRLHPHSLAEAEAILKQRRIQIAEQGYHPKYSDEELVYLAKHGQIGEERFQVRLLEKRFMNDPNTPDVPLSGKMGMVMTTENGKGAKYWSTSFDQLEDADTDPKIICEKLGLEYNPKQEYVLTIVDSEKAVPLTGVKSVPATFEELSAFSNKELPSSFPKSVTDKIMTPEFQAAYNQHYRAAVKAKALPNLWSKDVDGFNDYLLKQGMLKEERKLFTQRMEMHRIIGNNQDYLGNGLTKDMLPDSPNEYGAVETFNFERKEVNLAQLKEAGALRLIEGIKPL